MLSGRGRGLRVAAEVSSLLQGPPIGVPLRLLQGLQQAEQNTEVLLQKALGHVRLSR